MTEKQLLDLIKNYFNDKIFDSHKKNVLKKSSLFTKIEEAIRTQFHNLLADKIGFDSMRFRLKLEESSDAKYIQIPRFDRFVESISVAKENSILYNS